MKRNQGRCLALRARGRADEKMDSPYETRFHAGEHWRSRRGRRATTDHMQILCDRECDCSRADRRPHPFAVVADRTHSDMAGRAMLQRERRRNTGRPGGYGLGPPVGYGGRFRNGTHAALLRWIHLNLVACRITEENRRRKNKIALPCTPGSAGIGCRVYPGRFRTSFIEPWR